MSGGAPDAPAACPPFPAPPYRGRTRVYGLLGHPIEGSLSPVFQNAGFAALGLDGVYVPFPTRPEHLHEAVRGLVRAGVRGFNLTVPHKQAILPLLAEITPQAQAIGAVNTVRVEGERLSGTNTDGSGLLAALAEDLDWRPAGKRVLLLGAGGAARGIAVALLAAGVAALEIANRTQAKAEALAADCSRLHPGPAVTARPWADCATYAGDLLLQTTTVGMGGEGQPVDLHRITLADGLVDIVTHPVQTPLLQQAAALGIPHANGLGMLLHQGAQAFQFWTGHEAPLGAMRDALRAAIAERG